jgi:hypothetical protein
MLRVVGQLQVCFLGKIKGTSGSIERARVAWRINNCHLASDYVCGHRLITRCCQGAALSRLEPRFDAYPLNLRRHGGQGHHRRCSPGGLHALLSLKKIRQALAQGPRQDKAVHIDVNTVVVTTKAPKRCIRQGGPDTTVISDDVLPRGRTLTLARNNNTRLRFLRLAHFSPACKNNEAGEEPKELSEHVCDPQTGGREREMARREVRRVTPKRER